MNGKRGKNMFKFLKCSNKNKIDEQSQKIKDRIERNRIAEEEREAEKAERRKIEQKKYDLYTSYLTFAEQYYTINGLEKSYAIPFHQMVKELNYFLQFNTTAWAHHWQTGSHGGSYFIGDEYKDKYLITQLLDNIFTVIYTGHPERWLQILYLEFEPITNKVLKMACTLVPFQVDNFFKIVSFENKTKRGKMLSKMLNDFRVDWYKSEDLVTLMDVKEKF